MTRNHETAHIAPQSSCKFGIDRCDITPPVGIYHRMWGAATHDRSTGVHRPLTATALVLRSQSNGEEQILVAVDHCLLWAREMNALLDAVSQQADVPRDWITVAFSHTHAAGLMGLERVELPGGDLIPAYLATLAERIAGIVRSARGKLQTANITYGIGRCSLAAQRDFWDAEREQFVCGFNPGAPADDTVVVARVAGEDGKPLAVIVNYACHPTTLAWENTLISPDFPGALRDVVEQSAGAPCVFLQGASGDLGPREGFVGDPAVADRNGRQLGYAVLAALAEMMPPGMRFVYRGPVLSGATLGRWEYEPLADNERAHLGDWNLARFTVELPYRAELPTPAQTDAELHEWTAKELAAHAAHDAAAARDARAMLERLTRRQTRLRDLPPDATFPFPVGILRIGNGVWLTVEGELYQWFQRSLRERFPQLAIVVITLANGSRVSYLPTRDAYGKGIYQETIAVLAPGCLEELLERVAMQIEQAAFNFL